jgi:hypothetical protein
MKVKKLQVLMIVISALAMACVFQTVSAGEQTTRYAAEQEGKHIFLAQAKEDIGALRSCLMPHYRPSVKPELNPGVSNISAVMPSAQMAPPIVQPDPTAIAASPRPEIMTGAEGND